MSDGTERARFEQVDWDRQGRRGVPRPSRWTLAGLGLYLLLAAAFCYDYVFVTQVRPLVGTWDPRALEWLFLLGSVTLVVGGVFPMLKRPARTRERLAELAESRAAVVAVGYLTLFFGLGLVGPLVHPSPEIDVLLAFNPPVGFSVDQYTARQCVGPVVDGRCQGTLAYPLGTNGDGKSVFWLSVYAMRVALVVAVVTTAIIVPIATAVGTVAGYVGGWADDLLMRYVEIQQTVPAFLVYVILAFYFLKTLYLIVIVFGLLGWGGVARVVRAETIQRKEAPFVTAARSDGASHLRVLVRHVVPNVSNSVVTAVTVQIPTLIIAEASVSFLQLGDVDRYSFGRIIADAFGRIGFMETWWTFTLPALLLAGAVLSFNVLGDALRDVLDPRG
ncbi:ABC transporter permease [Halorarius halobius]|uniref:ABC transporter permease n=1 Tax=Halorarius halobius TaxID=2962671 RepID=UPI0020CC8567|nr:ABC transporter permease [Halorarius halobius]